MSTPPPARMARIFRELGAAFATPEGLADGSLALEVEDSLADLPPGIGPRARELREGVARASLPALRRDFTRLFTGPPRPRAQPYESTYRDTEGRLMGEPAARARAAYREAGLRPACRSGLLPDHVSVECEFVAVLAEREQRARRGGDREAAAGHRKARDRFLREHLAPFVPPLARAVEAGARTRAYRALGALARALIAPWTPPRRRRVPDREIAARLPDVREGACSLCGTCALACEPGALRLRADDRAIELVLDARACDGCGVCRTRCPEGALVLAPAVLDPATRTLARSATAACSGCGGVLEVSLAALAAAGRTTGSAAAREHLRLCLRCRSRRLVLSARPVSPPLSRSSSP